MHKSEYSLNPIYEIQKCYFRTNCVDNDVTASVRLPGAVSGLRVDGLRLKPEYWIDRNSSNRFLVSLIGVFFLDRLRAPDLPDRKEEEQASHESGE